ncbi:PhzF family phenazine biosynthesis protein [Actinoplanes sp. NPDC026670]|uniref:PhzF family phenazine biosynthesis protein n=1 Tax=Actinoplanes sp. NPDC026670 TaxID=3154700 RepID=UPI0034000BE3
MVTVVDACVRDSSGGSPTVVADDDAAFSDADRCAIVRSGGASHGAFLDLPVVRFFTRTEELRNCGHGTIAAHAVLLDRSGRAGQRVVQQTGGRTFEATATRLAGGAIEVWFDQGPVTVTPPAGDLRGVLGALGIDGDPGGIVVASPGTPRLLIPYAGLMSLTPDFPRLAAECRDRGLLGCFVYHLDGPVAWARLFAPAIGVDEDVANANSSGCLAAHLGRRVEVWQGDALGRPSAVRADTDGRTTRVGGIVRLR